MEFFMEFISIVYTVVYLIIGLGAFWYLWNKFNIQWESERWDTRTIMICCIPAWPVVLSLILGIGFLESLKRRK